MTNCTGGNSCTLRFPAFGMEIQTYEDHDGLLQKTVFKESRSLLGRVALQNSIYKESAWQIPYHDSAASLYCM